MCNLANHKYFLLMMQKILLLHGALGSAQSFSALEKALSADFEVYSFSFGGHGENFLQNESFSIARFAEEVLQFLEKNEIDAISIFGYSMGGYVGLYLAKYFPQKVSKLFTLATKLDWTVEGAKKEAILLNPEKIKEKIPKYAAILGQLHGDKWEVLTQKTAELLLNLGENPPLKVSDFEEITNPVCIGVGDRDVMVSIEESVKVYRLLKNGQFWVAPNTPHALERVNVNELAHQIKKYFMKE